VVRSVRGGSTQKSALHHNGTSSSPVGRAQPRNPANIQNAKTKAHGKAEHSFRRTPYRDRELMDPYTPRREYQQDVHNGATSPTSSANAGGYSRVGSVRQDAKSTPRTYTHTHSRRRRGQRDKTHVNQSRYVDRDTTGEDDGRSSPSEASLPSVSEGGANSSGIAFSADVDTVLELVARMKRDRESELEGKLGVRRMLADGASRRRGGAADDTAALPVGWRSTEQPHLVSRWARQHQQPTFQNGGLAK
jgi:hypothetical protein